jgi:CDP-glycerol glycerophosphotransferase (TagB/SpsB family)
LNEKEIHQNLQFINAKKVVELIDNIHKKDGHVGFYLPTHRQEGSEQMLKKIIGNLQLCQNQLSKEKIYIIVKLHRFHQNEKFPKNMMNVIFVKDHELEGDIYPLLPLTDFLITDYSSIYIDYLLTNKPIIFLDYDFQSYIEVDREFYYSYKEVTPGPKVSFWNDLVTVIKKELNKDTYIKDRQKMIKLFHSYPDGNSSKRVGEKIYDSFVNKNL